MAEIADVVGGEIITDTWGNQIRDRVVSRYATVAALPAVTDGTVAFVDADDLLYLRRGGVWTKLSPGTVSYVQIVTDQTGITGADTDILGTGSITIPAGRRIRVTTKLQIVATGEVGSAQLKLKEDTATVGLSTTTLGAGWFAAPQFSTVLTPTPGSHVYKTTAAITVGTLSVLGSVIPSWILVEDIGPA